MVATHENHIDGKIDAWLPVRAAIAHASVQFIAEQTADWLVLAEDDAYISVVRLRIFLAQLDARKPHFWGHVHVAEPLASTSFRLQLYICTHNR